MTKQNIAQAADYFDLIMDEPLTDNQKEHLNKLHSMVTELSHQVIDEQESNRELKHQLTGVKQECESLNSCWVKVDKIRELTNVSE